ncbi:hypothetical protein NKJ88_31905 [Mesorhizobium sp. M0016]|uniref:hypothetical protein n=1 Tax=Mesorhizobium sp. M0016 TaxID=2956843 RepID=UPI00333B43F6
MFASALMRLASTAMAATRRLAQSISTRWTMPGGVQPSDVKPSFVSRSDPAAQWTAAIMGHAFFAYATDYLTT